MDDLLLELLLRELAPRLAGARIEKAYGYGPHDIALRLWLRPDRLTLILSADSAAPLIALVDDEPPEPRERSPLLEAVRSRLVPGTLVDIAKAPDDRVVTIRTTSAAGEHRLVAELVPRAPALLLLEPDGRIVAGSGPGLPGRRGLIPGRQWVPPEHHAPLAHATRDRDPALSGLPGYLAREVEAQALAHGTPLADARRELERASRDATAPHLYELPDGRLVPAPLAFLSLSGTAEAFPSVSDLIAAWYRRAVAGGRERSLRTQLRLALTRRLERLARTTARVEKEAAGAAEADNDRRAGELLLAWQAAAQHDGASVRVPHPDGEGELAIPLLKERASLVVNAQAYFERYRRRRRGIEATRIRLAAVAEECSHLEEMLVSVETALPGELPSIADELKSDGILDSGAAREAPKRKPSSAPRAKKLPQALAPRAYAGVRGSEILVGRTSRGNDHLTFHLARDEDFWLHADAPGAHVVLRNPRRTKEPDPDELIEAAALAAWFSKLHQATAVEVHWTGRSSVRHIAGAAPGRVQLRAYRSVRVRPAFAGERFDLGTAGGEQR